MRFSLTSKYLYQIPLNDLFDPNTKISVHLIVQAGLNETRNSFHDFNAEALHLMHFSRIVRLDRTPISPLLKKSGDHELDAADVQIFKNVCNRCVFTTVNR